MHAAGHVRDAFWIAVDSGELNEEKFRTGLAKWIEEDGSYETVSSLVGKLMHCTDTLPGQGDDLRNLGLEFGKSTYAAATRAILNGRSSSWARKNPVAYVARVARPRTRGRWWRW